MLHELIGQGNMAVVTLHTREAIEPADWITVLRNDEIAGGTWIKFQSTSQPERLAALGSATSLQGFSRWPTIKTINF